MDKMTEEILRRMAVEQPFVTWCLEYIQCDEYRRTFYKSHTLAEAVNWLYQKTDGKAYIVYAGILVD